MAQPGGRTGAEAASAASELPSSRQVRDGSLCVFRWSMAHQGTRGQQKQGQARGTVIRRGLEMVS